MKKYLKYKPSGLEWLEEVPYEWEIVKFSNYIDFQEGPGIMAEDFKDKGVPLIRIINLKPNYVNLEGCNYLDEIKVETKWKHFKLCSNDLLISCSASTGLVSRVNEFSAGSIAYTGIIRLRPACDSIERDFINILVRSDFYLIQIEKLKSGTTIQHYGPTHLRKIKIILPSLPEQRSIVRFLNYKIEQIDNFIVNRQRQIKLLKEQKASVIKKAVTKGINPKTKMKPSGIEWIGEVPEHWKIIKIKYTGTIINGYAFDSKDFKDFGVRVVKIANIQTRNLSWDEESFVDKTYYHDLPNFRLRRDDLVFALTRPIISTGIKAAIVNTDEDLLLNQRNAVFRPNNINKRYLYYIIFNENFIQFFESLIDDTGQQPNISSEEISNIKIPFPSIREQNEIVEFLDYKCNELENLISKYQKQIELMQEYRTSLVSQAVTGKIDVRDWQPKNKGEVS